jgi:hypothetical protein
MMNCGIWPLCSDRKTCCREACDKKSLIALNTMLQYLLEVFFFTKSYFQNVFDFENFGGGDQLKKNLHSGLNRPSLNLVKKICENLRPNLKNRNH